MTVRLDLSDENEKERARVLLRMIVRDELTAFVPACFPFEIAHALVKAARRGRLDPARLEPALLSIEDLELPTESAPDTIRHAAALAHRLRIGAYDAAYLWVAESHSIPFVAADRPLYETAYSAGYEAIWLGDLPA